MANGLLYLEHIPSGRRFRLAKYFPSTGWYAFAALEDQERNEAEAFAMTLQHFMDPGGYRYGDSFGGPNAWYKRHQDAKGLSVDEVNDGPQHYRLVYEP